MGGKEPAFAYDYARLEDLKEIAQIEAEAWPSGEDMIADEGKFAKRQEIGGLMTTKMGGKIVGYISFFKPDWANPDKIRDLHLCCTDDVVGVDPQKRWNIIAGRYGIPSDWHAATSNGLEGDAGKDMHDPDGKIVFAIGITTSPSYRGKGIVQKTLAAAIESAKEQGAEYFMGFGRLPAYRDATKNEGVISLDEYLHSTETRGGVCVPRDYGFRFHWKEGALPVTTVSGKIGYIGIPNSMKDDPESLNAGTLVLNALESSTPYPLPKIRENALWTPSREIY